LWLRLVGLQPQVQLLQQQLQLDDILGAQAVCRLLWLLWLRVGELAGTLCIMLPVASGSIAALALLLWRRLLRLLRLVELRRLLRVVELAGTLFIMLPVAVGSIAALALLLRLLRASI